MNKINSSTTLSADEDRLSKRKSIGETISLQVEVESRNSPEKEVEAKKQTFATISRSEPLKYAPLRYFGEVWHFGVELFTSEDMLFI